jgi:hypothetical protein
MGALKDVLIQGIMDGRAPSVSLSIQPHPEYRVGDIYVTPRTVTEVSIVDDPYRKGADILYYGWSDTPYRDGDTVFNQSDCVSFPSTVLVKLPSDDGGNGGGQAAPIPPVEAAAVPVLEEKSVIRPDAAEWRDVLFTDTTMAANTTTPTGAAQPKIIMGASDEMNGLLVKNQDLASELDKLRKKEAEWTEVQKQLPVYKQKADEYDKAVKLNTENTRKRMLDSSREMINETVEAIRTVEGDTAEAQAKIEIVKKAGDESNTVLEQLVATAELPLLNQMSTLMDQRNYVLAAANSTNKRIHTEYQTAKIAQLRNATAELNGGAKAAPAPLFSSQAQVPSASNLMKATVEPIRFNDLMSQRMKLVTAAAPPGDAAKQEK